MEETKAIDHQSVEADVAQFKHRQRLEALEERISATRNELRADTAAVAQSSSSSSAGQARFSSRRARLTLAAAEALVGRSKALRGLLDGIAKTDETSIFEDAWLDADPQGRRTSDASNSRQLAHYLCSWLFDEEEEEEEDDDEEKEDPASSRR